MSAQVKDERSRNWVIVFYPDSAPENFMDVISGLCVKCFLSPLHENDVNADGTPKKPHYHLLLMFSGKKSCDQIQEISDLLSGVKVIQYECAVRDCKAVARYLIHLDNPEKFQYPRDSVVSFGGVDYIEYIETSSDVSAILREITEFCIDNMVDSLPLLLTYSLQVRPDWFRIITRQTIYVTALLRSIDWSYTHCRDTLFIRSTGEVYRLKNFERIPKKGLTCDNKCDNI